MPERCVSTRALAVGAVVVFALVAVSGACTPSPPEGRVDDATVLDALWDLVWAGEVTNDSFAPLRAKVVSTSKRSSPRRTAVRTVPAIRS